MFPHANPQAQRRREKGRLRTQRYRERKKQVGAVVVTAIQTILPAIQTIESKTHFTRTEISVGLCPSCLNSTSESRGVPFRSSKSPTNRHSVLTDRVGVRELERDVSKEPQVAELTCNTITPLRIQVHDSRDRRTGEVEKSLHSFISPPKTLDLRLGTPILDTLTAIAVEDLDIGNSDAQISLNIPPRMDERERLDDVHHTQAEAADEVEAAVAKIGGIIQFVPPNRIRELINQHGKHTTDRRKIIDIFLKENDLAQMVASGRSTRALLQ